MARLRSGSGGFLCPRQRRPTRLPLPKKTTPLGVVFFLYNENPALGAGGSEALLAMGQDKKTPFDVE